MPVSLLVVQNDWDKPLGRIADALEAAGATLDVRAPDGPLPDPAGYDGLVVLPGIADPVDDDPAVHLARDAIARALASDVPVLGLCLGGQLLAQALGGDAYACTPELGYFDVRATPAAAADPLLHAAPPSFSTFHAHAFAFRPPAGATVLLENDVCVQAFRLGEAWALQCHPEIAVEWADALAEGTAGADVPGLDPRTSAFFARNGVDPDGLRRDARAAAETAHAVAVGIAAGLVERCLAARDRRAATR